MHVIILDVRFKKIFADMMFLKYEHNTRLKISGVLNLNFEWETD